MGACAACGRRGARVGPRGGGAGGLGEAGWAAARAGGAGAWREALERCAAGGLEGAGAGAGAGGLRARVWPALLGLHAPAAPGPEVAALREGVARRLGELGAALGGEGEGLLEESDRAARAAALFAAGEGCGGGPAAAAGAARAATKRRVGGDVPRTEPGAPFLEAAGGAQRARLGRLLKLYALQDPGVGYCQGMGDLLAALLRVWPEDDAGAFWVFGALIGRLRGQFSEGAPDVAPQLARAAELAGGQDRALLRALRARDALACPFLFQPVLLLLRRELSLPETLSFWERYFALQSLHPGRDLRAALGAALLRHYREDILALPRGSGPGDLTDLVRLFHHLPRPVDLDLLARDLREFLAADAPGHTERGGGGGPAGGGRGRECSSGSQEPTGRITLESHRGRREGQRGAT